MTKGDACSAGVGGRLMLAAPHDAERRPAAHQIYVPAYTSSIGPRIRGRPRGGVPVGEGERGTYLRRRGRGAYDVGVAALLEVRKSGSKADLQAAHRPACVPWRISGSPQIHLKMRYSKPLKYGKESV